MYGNTCTYGLGFLFCSLSNVHDNQLGINNSFAWKTFIDFP